MRKDLLCEIDPETRSPRLKADAELVARDAARRIAAAVQDYLALGGDRLSGSPETPSPDPVLV